MYTSVYQNWGMQGYTYFFLILVQDIDCGYSLGGSNVYPQSDECFEQNYKKNVKIFQMKFSMFDFEKKNL